MPRRSRLPFFLWLAAGALVLAGCTDVSPRPQFAEIAFTDRPPFKLDVREIEIERAYQPPRAAPNVEHLFHVPPAAAAERWARDRLAAAGPRNRARYVIREASVVELPLEHSAGMSGALTTGQAERYDARLVVELRIFFEGDGSQTTLTAEVTYSRAVPKNLTLREREVAWHEMTQTMLCELDGLLDVNIRKAFPYLIL